MYKKFTTLVLLAATWVIFLPSTGSASTSEKNNSSAIISNENLILQQKRGGGKNSRYWEPRGRRRNGTWYGYKNYGQYRRTQVGNRRYRTVRRSIWRDGQRVSVWRRIFY